MQDRISFVLDDRIVSVDFSKYPELKPSTTVLNYLRSLPFHKGVKEGCAEGDCGACTVVIAEKSDDGSLTYKAVDSCLVFLPMIHGKQLITVENLAVMQGREKILHPVQQKMVETDGTQCGYCTPGIIMSLFALYKNHRNPGREVIDDALTGNLCRCTGYRPIIEAAVNACSGDGQDHFSAKENEIIALLDTINPGKETLELRSPEQLYLKPFTLEEGLKLRKQYTSAVIINGSTDIALRQTKKKELLPVILDLSGVSELKMIQVEQHTYEIGAGVSMEQLKDFSEGRFPVIHSMLKVFGSLQIRNLATIGGNIGSASPIGDILPILFSLGVCVKVKGTASERIIEIDKFITGYRKTDLSAEELITAIILPVFESNVITRSYKISKRKDLDISTVSGAFMLKLKDGIVHEIRIAFGGMAEKTKFAAETMVFLSGKKWSRDQVEEAMLILEKEFSPISDARAEKEFRSIAARNLLLKFYLDTVSSQGGLI